MLLNLLNNIYGSTANREPRTANQSSLNFFNSFKDKLLFIKICLALLLQKLNINLVKYFFNIFICFVKISSLIENSLSLRGFAEAIYINWIASLISFVRNDDKNNFSKINLVKTFLTYLINFDTYRGKRRNLVCLNKKFFHQGVIK